MRGRFFGACLIVGAVWAQAPERRLAQPVGLYTDYGDYHLKLTVFRLTVEETAKTAKLPEGTIHFLAQDLTAASINDVAANGRVYSANERLGDPKGFLFYATNNNGVYEIGDRAPMIARTRLVAHVPAPAKLRIVRGDVKVAEADGHEIAYTPAEPGPYRLEARVGEDRLWIQTAPIHLEAVVGRGITLPSFDISPTVEVKKDITYVEGKESDAAKHKLDLYLPKAKTGFPVLIFLHGGNWRSGDRSIYPPLGNRFAKEGIGVVVPSYRLMPGAPHPAQIEDAVAAVEWTLKNMAGHGGDGKRVWVSGHSAGGHLASYVGLERRFWPQLKGVISMSGVYDVSPLPAFAGAAADVSPIKRIAAGAPPFTITYCQNDYPTLAIGAKQFDEALRRAGVSSQLVYVPGKNHISEIADIWRDDDPTALAVVRAVLGR
jgi:acetyl esterase/lipase